MTATRLQKPKCPRRSAGTALKAPFRLGRHAFFVADATGAVATFFFLPASVFGFFLVVFVAVFAMAILPWFSLRTLHYSWFFLEGNPVLLSS
jgi:hypothetical protein